MGEILRTIRECQNGEGRNAHGDLDLRVKLIDRKKNEGLRSWLEIESLSKVLRRG